MQLARSLPTIETPWRRFALAFYLGINAILFVILPVLPHDWVVLWEHLPAMVAEGTLYDGGPLPFVWSPVLAWLLAPILALGFWPYFSLHVAAIALLRSPRLIATMLASWAFWVDTVGANTMTFVAVAGILAVTSRRWALVYLALCLLMPRPVQVPLAVWLLWRDRSLWRPFAALFAIHAVLVAFSGYGPAWIEAALTYTGSPGADYGPTAIFGTAWLIIGVPLAGLLAWRGWPGVGGLALTPYTLVQYTMMMLVDLRLRHPERVGAKPMVDSDVLLRTPDHQSDAAGLGLTGQLVEAKPEHAVEAAIERLRRRA